MNLGTARFVETEDRKENLLHQRRKTSRNRTRKINNDRVFVTVDFENVEESPAGGTVWWRMAVVVVPFATGVVTEARLFGARRNVQVNNPSDTMRFWKKNLLAFNLNQSEEEHDVDVAEESIAQYFDDLRERIPNVRAAYTSRQLRHGHTRWPSHTVYQHESKISDVTRWPSEHVRIENRDKLIR